MKEDRFYLNVVKADWSAYRASHSPLNSIESTYITSTFYNFIDEQLEAYKSGFKGACRTCEIVGEKNKELEWENSMLKFELDNDVAVDEFNSCIADGSISIIEQTTANSLLINYGQEKALVEILPDYINKVSLTIKPEISPTSYIEVGNITWGIF
jgi:hypothetical protein